MQINFGEELVFRIREAVYKALCAIFLLCSIHSICFYFMWVASFIVNAKIIMATVSGEDVMNNFLIIVPFQASRL